MNLRTALLIMLAIIIAATPALANKELAKVAPAHSAQMPATREIFEGFEGVFPPAGWTAVSNTGHVNPEAWFQGDLSPYEGLYHAECQYAPDLSVQDNELSFTHTVAVGEDKLNFMISGSQYWSINYDCTVEVDGAEMFSWADIVTANWLYEPGHVDLAGYMGQTVTITFRYAGSDGAAIYLDAVALNDQEPPPPPEPPENDTCESAWDNGYYIEPGAFYYEADNTLAVNDYPMVYPSCTGYSFSGLDVVWAVCMEQGDVLDVTMDAGFDASFFLLSDCADPDLYCVIGADDPETFVYTAAATGTYYLVCGGYSSYGFGPFSISGMLTGAGCDPVATEDTNWGSLKSLYR